MSNIELDYLSVRINIKKCILLIEPTKHHEVLDAYIAIFYDLGYKVLVCSSFSNRQHIKTNKFFQWIDIDDYRSIARMNPSFTLFVTYHHSMNLYLKEINCPIGLVIHNANYFFDTNQSTALKGYIHRFSEKITGFSTQKKKIRNKVSLLIARSAAMKNYVQGLADIPVICIADIYIKAHESPINNNRQIILTHIGRIDENLKNIKYLQKIIKNIQSRPKEVSLNIIGKSKSFNITPGESIKVYDDYISSDLFSKLITESNYILFLPNKNIRVKGSVEKVGYSHIPGSIHDAARHMRQILIPDWYPKDDLVKDLFIPYENCEDIIHTISKNNFKRRIDPETFKLRIDNSLKEADKILSGIISDQ